MVFFSELKQFIKSILSWLCLFLAFSGFFFLFGLKKFAFFGKEFFFPAPAAYSFSAQLFKIAQRNLLPEGVKLVVLNPLDAFLSQVKISLLMSFMLTFPFFIYKIIVFAMPGLYEKEKKAILKTLVPLTFLFAGGCLFAYFLLIPFTFKALYSYASLMDITSFFSMNDFIGLTLGFMVASGIMFLLPVFMVLLSWLGIIKPNFWLNNWRYAILFFLIVSAIITPDGSGISMILLALPLTALYFSGTLITMKYKPNA